MAWRVVVIGNPSQLRIENDQLVITREEEVRLPVEDLAALVLESPAIILTAAVLARLAAYDVLLIACDERHLPCYLGLPCAGHSRLAKMQRLQLAATLPFRKRCWQAVARRKIANQAACLRLTGHDGAAALDTLAAAVGSGDPANLEARAARWYFRRLFGRSFLRGEADGSNAALDYGYAVLRAVVARALTAHGLLPAQGIHHRSELNPFNLADDFIEPLRPLVDLCVAEMGPVEELTKEHRQRLVSLLGHDIRIDGARHAVLRAAERMAASYLAACRDKDPRRLALPELLPLALHRYE